MPDTAQQNVQSMASAASDRRLFFEQLLMQMVTQLEAFGGLVWECSAETPRAICQQHRADRDDLKLGLTRSAHEQFLIQAMQRRQPEVIFPKTTDQQAASGETTNGQPAIVTGPITRDDSKVLIELFFDATESKETFQHRIAEVGQTCEAVAMCQLPPWPSGPRSPQQPGAAPTEPGKPAIEPRGLRHVSVDQFAHAIHQTLDPVETAREIANESRRAIDCDRVSVLRRRGGRFHTVSISGQPTVNRRSNTVRLLENVAAKVFPTRLPFEFPGESAVPPQIDRPLQKYLAQSPARTLIAVPFFDRPAQLAPVPGKPPEVRKLIGGMIIEHFNEQLDAGEIRDSVDTVSRHAGDAWRNSWQHQNLFLYPLWKWLGKSKILLAAKHLPKTIAAALAIVALTCALIFIPAPFRMSCSGHLRPVIRHNVFPNMDGVVDEVLVGHGEQVVEGQPLLLMVNLDLEYRINEVDGQIDELQQMIRSTRQVQLSGDDSDQARLQQQNLRGQQVELESLEKSLALLIERRTGLSINSPINGEVMTWDVRDQLLQRPVTVNERLLEIADTDGAWELELNLPDRKVGHFLKAWQPGGDKIQVEFMSAAEPGEIYHGHVTEVGTTTELTADQEQVLKIRVAIDSDELPLKQSRSGVSAYIKIGKRSLGYVWLHPVQEFFQSRVLFPLW